VVLKKRTLEQIQKGFLQKRCREIVGPIHEMGGKLLCLNS